MDRETAAGYRQPQQEPVSICSSRKRKTAVLVERIISMISEGPSPLNIDQLLVMTFTNAAASEMRERIGAAVEKKLKEDPGNEHLWLQAALIPQAQIMTIDSFCLDLIPESL